MVGEEILRRQPPEPDHGERDEGQRESLATRLHSGRTSTVSRSPRVLYNFNTFLTLLTLLVTFCVGVVDGQIAISLRTRASTSERMS